MIVKSLSNPPRSLSIAVYTILPERHVDLVGAQPLQDGECVAALEDEFGKRRLVEDDDVLAAARAARREHGGSQPGVSNVYGASAAPGGRK